MLPHCSEGGVISLAATSRGHWIPQKTRAVRGSVHPPSHPWQPVEKFGRINRFD
jgi:hypothetical protein